MRVVSIAGRRLDLEFRLVGSQTHVHAEPIFLARVLSESMPDERILELLGESAAASEQAWAWMSEHASEVIDADSIRVHGEVDYPNETPSESLLTAKFRREFAERWAAQREVALAAIRVEIARLGSQLEFESDLSAYEAATLDDLLGELVNAHFEAYGRRRTRASIEFEVRDSKWIRHLERGDEFDSLAWPG